MLGGDFLSGRDGGRLSIDGRQLLCDLESFRLARKEGRFEDGLEVHAGDFLADFYVPDTGPFMEWVDRRRRALKEQATDCARRLARDAEADGDGYQAVGWWTRAVELSPYNEEAVTRLVWALTQSGNRGTASDVYRRFQDRMLDDLNLEPSQVTRASVARALNDVAIATRGNVSRASAHPLGQRSDAMGAGPGSSYPRPFNPPA
jgi:DNA-binding SARP family transcriptional activator